MSYALNLLIFLSVLALAYGAARLLGQQPRRRSSGALRVRDSLSLGKDRALLLVEVGDRLMLVGATPQSITLVQQLDGALAPTAAVQPALDPPQPAPAPAFAQTLRQALGGEAPAAATLSGGLPALPAVLAPRLRSLAATLATGTRPLASAVAARTRALAAAVARPSSRRMAEAERARGALRRLTASLDGAGEQP